MFNCVGKHERKRKGKKKEENKGRTTERRENGRNKEIRQRKKA